MRAEPRPDKNVRMFSLDKIVRIRRIFSRLRMCIFLSRMCMSTVLSVLEKPAQSIFDRQTVHVRPIFYVNAVRMCSKVGVSTCSGHRKLNRQ